MKGKLKAFAEEVSILGIRYIVREDSGRVRRIVWLCLVTAGLVLLAYQIVDRCRYYFSYPTIANVQMIYKEKLDFPTLTLCNENRVRLSAARELGVQKLLLSLYPPYPSSSFQPDVKALDQVVENAGNVSWSEWYRNLAQPLEEAVVTCEWHGTPCKPDWLTTVSTDMGFCVQFNGGDVDLSTSQPGAIHGLSLLLKVDQDDYLIAGSATAGFRVLAHSPWEVPLMSEFGQHLPAGYGSLISITRQDVVTLPRPYGDCQERENFSYSDCVLYCLTKFSVDQCGCKDIHMPSFAPVCNPKEYYNCLLTAQKEYIENDMQASCNCPAACHKIFFRPAVSQAPLSDLAIAFVSNLVLNISSERIRKDYMTLNVYYPTIVYKETREKQAYSVMALFSDIGGAMGLVLGGTFLTLCEVADFIICHLCGITKQKKRNKRGDKERSAEVSMV